MKGLQKSYLLTCIRRKVYLLILLLVVPFAAHTQENYANRTLHDIAVMISELNICKSDTSRIFVSRVSPQRSIVVERGVDGVINHIGFDLFDRTIMERHSTPLYYFIERYLLGLMLLENDMDIYTRLKMDRVRITSEIHLDAPLKRGLQKIISDDAFNSSICITSNGKEYTFSCFSQDKLLIQMAFPMRYELISGYTKLEAERGFYPDLLSFIGSDKEVDTMALSEYDLEAYNDSLYCTFQETYILEDMISTSYYKKSDNQYIPLFDSRHVAESLYNIFNSTHNLNVIAEVTQSLYGENNKLSYEISINDLTRYLRSQGCHLYTGLKESHGNEVKLTVMAVNHEFGYQHLLICSTDKQVLSKPEAHKVKVKMYCHIPTHNITSILGK